MSWENNVTFSSYLLKNQISYDRIHEVKKHIDKIYILFFDHEV